MVNVSDFAKVSVRRSSKGLSTPVRGGIRKRVVDALLEAGENGLSTQQLSKLWPGNGSIRKVHGAMRILASDTHGYEIENLKHPTDREKTRWRIVGGEEPDKGSRRKS